MWIALTDATLCNIVIMAYNVCDYRLYELFARTVLFSSTIESQYRALWILQASKNFIAIFLSLLTFLLNTCLAVDLILMLRYPFASKQKNIPIYLAFSLGIAILLSVIWVLTIHYKHFENRNTWAVPNKYVSLCVMAVLASYFISSFASILYAMKHFCQSGIS